MREVPGVYLLDRESDADHNWRGDDCRRTPSRRRSSIARRRQSGPAGRSSCAQNCIKESRNEAVTGRSQAQPFRARNGAKWGKLIPGTESTLIFLDAGAKRLWIHRRTSLRLLQRPLRRVDSTFWRERRPEKRLNERMRTLRQGARGPLMAYKLAGDFFFTSRREERPSMGAKGEEARRERARAKSCAHEKCERLPQRERLNRCNPWSGRNGGAQWGSLLYGVLVGPQRCVGVSSKGTTHGRRAGLPRPFPDFTSKRAAAPKIIETNTFKRQPPHQKARANSAWPQPCPPRSRS